MARLSRRRIIKKLKLYGVMLLAVYAATITLHDYFSDRAVIVPARAEGVADAAVQPKPEKPAPVVNRTGEPSQEQKAQTAVACEHIAANRQDLYGKYASPNQFKTECYYTLLAMAKAESTFDCSRIGDNGKSHGCFQIQTALHGVSVEQANDYAFAAEWTMDKMVRESQFPNPHTKTYAIQAHNGIVMVSPGHMNKQYALAVLATAKEYKADGL